MSNMVVRTNVFALNAHRNMKNVGLEQSRASNRLSSGYRINSAADDAAGLAISETMRAQIRGLDQASRNSQDGQAMLQTTEGGLEEIGNMLQRTRELLVQASNDTNTQAQRSMIEQEMAQLGQEIGGMQQRVEFNTNRVLAMGPTPVNGAAAAAFGTAQGAIATAQATFATARTAFETAQTTFNTARETWDNSAQNAAAATAWGNAQNAFATATSTFNTAATAWSTAQDTFATAAQTFRTATLALNNGATSGNNVAWFQVGANEDQGITFDFETVSRVVGVASSLVSNIADTLVIFGTSSDSGIGFGEDISAMLGDVQEVMDSLNSVRANLGAVQNRMDYTMRSLDISSENLSDSESRVRNADMAREMMRFTMSNVLQQASISMLSQANQMPNNLLQILR